jgi:phenylpropionate dioxygenase-like ring-hydroxylating dioxygenase large terminal subunit
MTTVNDHPFVLDAEAIAALGTDPVPIEPYISPDYCEAERDLIFKKTWTYVGRVEQLPAPGSFFVKELPLCSTSLIVIRGRDGVVRAFHNMCPHRGNKLVWDEAGQANSMVCRFHGWAFRPDGSLSVVPEQEIFPGLDLAACGLTAVATDTWEGFIFINLDPDLALGLAEFLGPLGEELGGYPFDELTTCYAWRAELKANWKACLDAFIEGYHVRFLHRRSVADAFEGSADNRYCDAYGFKLYGDHRRLSIPGSSSRTPKPGEALAFRFGRPFVSREAGGPEVPACLNPTRNPSWAFDDISLFPNLALLLFNGSYLTHEFTPVSVDQTIWEGRYYFPPARNGADRFAQEYGACLLRDTLLEDASTLEQSQSVFASGARSTMILGEQEVAVRHLHAVVEDHVQGHPKLGW